MLTLTYCTPGGAGVPFAIVINLIIPGSPLLGIVATFATELVGAAGSHSLEFLVRLLIIRLTEFLVWLLGFLMGKTLPPPELVCAAGGVGFTSLAIGGFSKATIPPPVFFLRLLGIFSCKSCAETL